MVSRDYTQEVGLQTAEKRVPKAVAVIIFAALAAGGWYFVRAEIAAAHHETPPESAPAAPAHS